MNEIDKLTTEKPASFLELEKDKHVPLQFSEAIDVVDGIYKLCDSESEKCYRAGGIYKLTPDTLPTTVLTHILTLYIEKVRQQLEQVEGEEQKKALQVELTNIKNTAESLLSMLNKDEFKLDINSVLHIIHGYINGNLKPVFEHYETRRRITHQHKGD